MKEFRPHLVHAHLHEGCLIGMGLKAAFKVPLLFDFQGSLTGESIEHGFIREGGLASHLFRKVEEWIDRGADSILVSNRVLASPLIDRGLAVQEVGDWVDPDRFSPGPASPELAGKLGLPTDRPVAVYLGVISSYQGVDVLLGAAEVLKERGERVHFLVMGYPEAEFKARAERSGLADAVTFTGRVDYFQAALHLRLGALALAPKLSRTEGNGKVLLYMACGLPVVAFDLPVNREILGKDAQWVEPSPDRQECARRFADGVSALLRDRDKGSALARAGRERASRELGVEAKGEALIRAYQTALGGAA